MVDSTAEEMLTRGLKFEREGQYEAALKLYRQLLREHPGESEILMSLSRLEVLTGNTSEGIRLLNDFISLQPNEPSGFYALGIVFDSIGAIQQSLKCFEKVIQLAPDVAGGYLKLGSGYAKVGKRNAACQAFRNALVLEPGLVSRGVTSARNEPGNQELALAVSEVVDGYRRFAERIVGDLSADYSAAECSRLKSGFEALFRKSTFEYSDNDQQKPEFFFFPNLVSRAWYDSNEFDWVPAIEGAHQDILEEYLLLLDNPSAFSPYVQGGGNGRRRYSAAQTGLATLRDSEDWDAYHLSKAGNIEEHRQQCPKTSALMDAMPLARVDHYMPEIFFSRLKPGAHIVPHVGQANFRLTVHLGLIIPDNCGITVGREERKWEAGKVIVFDDSYEHEAWNRSDRDRVVFIFEIWHPDLNELEITGLKKFLESFGWWGLKFLAFLRAHDNMPS